MKRSLIVFSSIVLGLLLIAAYGTSSNVPSSDDKKVNKEFTVQPGGKLNIDMNTGASIYVEGWDKNVVSVNVTIKGRDSEEVLVNCNQSGNNVSVESEFKFEKRSNKANVELKVNIPKKYNVEYSTMGGAVHLLNAEGEFEGSTMGGEISLIDLKGKVEMKTMGGSIDVKNCDLDGKVETMGGSIDVDDLIGDLNLSTMGGSIKQNNVRARNGAEGKEVVLSTMGGEIEVDEAMNGVKVKTMGGAITVNKAAVFVDAETMGGNIEIKQIDGKIKATTMGGDIEVKMTGDPEKGGREVFLKSMGGDVHLTVPAKLSMDVEIEIGYDKDRDDVKIVSDFDLQQQRDVLKNNSKNNNLRYLIGTGAINGGKHKVKIKTIGGDVYLKKG
jgi:hypothetical protein